LQITVGRCDEALQQGDAEAQRLAGAGLGLSDDVVPVQRDGQGPYVLVAGPDGMVAQKRIVTASAVGSDWVISSGLKDGDQVIVSGIQRAQPGGVVKAMPAGEAPGGAVPAAAAPAPACRWAAPACSSR
jgi:membrane fusion protein (multidrug efflux system)